jgi:hypothetical protein
MGMPRTKKQEVCFDFGSHVAWLEAGLQALVIAKALGCKSRVGHCFMLEIQGH